MSQNNELPSLNILGSVSIASGFPRTIAQNSFVFGDNLSFVRGAHTIRLGGSLTRLQDNVNLVGLGSFLQFLSWPDFLLGLSAEDNGTGFSNVFASFDDFGLTNREFRVWEGTAFAQDDYRIRRSLTLNIGLRYERLGQFGDRLGRNASFDIGKADPNPAPSGSVAGYLVASNFPVYFPRVFCVRIIPSGTTARDKTRSRRESGSLGRFLPGTSRLVLRGGYGTYYSRPTGQAFYQNIFGAPFSVFRLNAGAGERKCDISSAFPAAVPYAGVLSFVPRVLSQLPPRLFIPSRPVFGPP